jgi:hypothetical protein
MTSSLVKTHGLKYTDGEIDVIPGKINGKSVKCVLDSGAETVIVRRLCIRPDQLIPDKKKTCSFGGKVERLDTAVIDIEAGPGGGVYSV